MAEDDVDVSIEQALDALAGEGDADFVARVRSIVYQNMHAGRMEKFLSSGSADSVADYVKRVAKYYCDWHDYVHGLCEAKEHALWEDYYTMLQRWAYVYLQRKRFPAHGDRRRHAADVAASAAAIILKTRFPFDVHFDRWAYHVLQIACLRHIDRIWNPTSLPDEQTSTIEALLESLRDPAAGEQQWRAEMRIDLERAVELLSTEARKTFIRLYYFEQKSFAEIASLMGRRVNALYKLHFDALQDLRKILNENGDIYG